MGRRAAREEAVKLLYQLEIQKEDRDKQIEYTLNEGKFSEKEREYIADVVHGVFENVEYIDGVIEKYSKGWKLNRISKIDLSILRLSIYEMKFRNDIPYSVSINEAIELAKKYSAEESGAFINGILGRISLSQ
mgnify:CR=1 FL=1